MMIYWPYDLTHWSGSHGISFRSHYYQDIGWIMLSVAVELDTLINERRFNKYMRWASRL